MFQLPGWLIAVIAVAAALVLVGVPLTIHGLITRRRHQQYMKQSEQDLGVYLRPRLSARASNYLDIVRPPSYVRRESDIQQAKATWTPLQTAELIAPENAPLERKDDSPSPPKAKQKRGLRDSIYGHSGAHAPKTRRQKKINKTIPLKDMNRSPLSAITEMTDSTANELPMPVELPAETKPHITPESGSAVSPVQVNATWSIPAQRQRPEHLSPLELDTPVSLKCKPSFEEIAELPISPSKSIVPEAPDRALPPLPTYQLYHKPSGAKRASQISTLTVGSSVLGGFSSSELNLPQTVNSGMQQFDFGFNSAPPARAGPSPGRETGWHGGRDVTSVIPGFDFHGQRTSTTSITESGADKREPRQEKTIEWTPGPDFFFGKQQPKSNQHSPEHPTVNRDKDLLDEHRQMIGSVSPTLLPPRPASVASSQPFLSDQTLTFARSRLSVSSTGSGRRNLGHRRQNCVRICISAIPVSPIARPGALIRRPSHISEAAEDSDEDTSSPEKVKAVNASPSRSATSHKQLSATRSIVDANSYPEAPPPVSRVVRTSVSGVRAAIPSASSSDSGEPRPDSDVFWTRPDDLMDSAKKNDPFAYPNRWALMPTRPGSLGLEPGTKLSVFEHPNSEEDSPILPSPCKPATANSSATRHSEATRPFDPRQAPAFPSTNINIQRSPSKVSTARSGPGSPVRRISLKDVEDIPTQDLRLSVAQLRSLDASGRQLNTKSKLWIAGDTPSTNQNHEDWKQLNALWEVSRSNSISSLSTRATPGMPTRHGSITASSSMKRPTSGLRANTSNGMFGSSKRKMAQPYSKHEFNLSNSDNQVPVPLVASNSTRFRNGSASGSPSRRSLASFSNVSLWEDESVRGDSPEPNSAAPSCRISLSARGQQPAGPPPTPPPPPPRLESLPDGPLPPQHYPWKLQQARNRPHGLGITIPPFAYNPHNGKPVLDPSPSQKQLKAQYFGSMDWDKDCTTTASNPANVMTDFRHSHEKENIVSLSASSATPTSSTFSSMSIPLPSSTVKHPSIFDRGRDLELDLDVYSTPPTSTETNINSFSYSHQRYNFNFPLPGSGGRRPGTAGTITSTGSGNDVGKPPSPTNTAHYPSGNGGVAEAPHCPSAHRVRKISPAQQRLKDELRERAAGVGSVVARIRSPPAQVLAEKHRARMDELDGTGSLASAIATPQGNDASDPGAGGSSGRGRPRDFDRERENPTSSPRPQYHHQHQQQPRPPGDQSLRSGSSSVASARSRSGTPVGQMKRMDGSKMPTPIPTPMPTPSMAGSAASGSVPGGPGAMGSSKTLTSLYDSEGFLKDSPLERESARAAGFAAAAAAAGGPDGEAVEMAGGGVGNVSENSQALTGAAGGLVGRSYRRMQ